jgi:hypothetical protein
MRRRLQLLDLAAREYPSDPEARMELAEAWYHIGERAGISETQVRTAFENAIAREPAFGPAYYHAIELTLADLGIDSARALTKQYLAVLPNDRRFQVVDIFLDRDRSKRERASALLNDLAPDSLLDAADVLRGAGAGPWSAEPIFRALLSRRDVLGSESERDVRESFALQLLRNGRPGAASEIVRGGVPLSAMYLTAPLAYANAIDIRVADSVFLAELRASTRSTLYALSWFGFRGDTATLGEIVRLGHELAGAATTRQDPFFARYLLDAASAYVALAGHDTTTALRLFSSLPDSFCSALCQPQRIVTARMLVAKGRGSEAVAALDRFPIRSSTPLDEPRWRLARAEAALATGDVRRAKHEYERIIRTFAPDNDWSRAVVAAANAGLASLAKAPTT